VSGGSEFVATTLLTLRAEKLTIAFDAVVALDCVSLQVEAGEVAGLIGPNGSGKTTMFNCICGYYAPSSGRIRLHDDDIIRLSPHQIARMGIGRTFQSPNLFTQLTVLENVKLAAESMAIGGSIFRGLHPRRNAGAAELAMHLLEDLGIEDYAHAYPLEIPVGIAKLADLARALSLSPKLLLLDEPAAGLNDAERERLAGLLNRLNERNRLTMLVVDHNMGFVMSLCRHLTVLASGKVISTGKPEAVRRDPAVVQAYLGEEMRVGA
jgi:ABC-type branched-subunit amino acid transport system ATPase component